jgi:hypothetical protein
MAAGSAHAHSSALRTQGCCASRGMRHGGAILRASGSGPHGHSLTQACRSLPAIRAIWDLVAICSNYIGPQDLPSSTSVAQRLACNSPLPWPSLARDYHPRLERADVYPGAGHKRGAGRAIAFIHPGSRDSGRAIDRPFHVEPGAILVPPQMQPRVMANDTSIALRRC